MNDYLSTITPVNRLMENYHHFDVKTIEGNVTLREFIAGTLNYHPAWIRALYTIRAGFVRVLGMRQDAIPQPTITPENLPFNPDEWAAFFCVVEAQEDRFWIATASDQHLDAYIVIAREERPAGQARFHVATVVKYNNWAGPVYFNVIRPFHHLVVSQMMKAGVRYQPLTPNPV